MEQATEIDIKKGIETSLSMSEYQAAKGLSNSQLSVLIDCPFKFYHRFISDGLQNAVRTPAMEKGTLIHQLILEPEQFDQQYHVIKRMRRDPRSKAWQEQLSIAGDKVILFEDELAEAKALQTAVMKNTVASALLEVGQCESSIFWEDKTTGLRCKGRPDFIGDGFVLDVKTSAQSSHKAFAKSMANYGYHRQAAMYLDGLAANGRVMEHFIFLVVETMAPFVVSLFLLKKEDIEQGRREYQKALENYKHFSTNDHWPAYTETVEDITLPLWAHDDERRGAYLL